MKRIAPYVFAILLCFMLTAEASALFAPYVNDYAEVMSESAAELIEASSVYIEDVLGIDILVLTVHDLRGYTPDEFARRTISRIPDLRDDYIMLLYSVDCGSVWVETTIDSANLQGAHIFEQYMQGPIKNGKRGRAVLDGYKAIARYTYDFMGVTPSEEMQQNLALGNIGSGNFWYVVAAMGSMMLLLRMFLINRKSQKRYAASQRPYTPATKRRYEGDIEFDRIRVETIELEEK